MRKRPGSVYDKWNISVVSCDTVSGQPSHGGDHKTFEDMKYNTSIKYTCTLHGHQLEHADKAKYLGVTIQSDLKWNSHINNITTKANKTLGFLCRNINISST